MHPRILALVFILTIPCAAVQVTLETSVPLNTPGADSVYVCGEGSLLGNWDPDVVELEKVSSILWRASLEANPGDTLEYIYTRGDSASREADLMVDDIDHRIREVPDTDAVFMDTVFAWKDAPITKAPYLSWDTPDCSEMGVSWGTREEATSRVVYGTDPSYGDTIEDGSLVERHFLRIPGLDPGGTYHYQVSSSNGYQSVNNAFKTPPEPGEPYCFVAYGDTRSQTYAHANVVDEIAAADPDFIIHSGDLVNNGHILKDWYMFFNVISKVTGSAPLMPSLGNHEGGAQYYFNFFTLPGNEEYFSFDYGDAHFICLNSEIAYASGSPQYDWLLDDLQNVSPSARWIFVYFHSPPYSSGNHGSDIGIRNAWCPIFEEYGVDIVFNGHDHNYERGLVNGVYYVVTGGGGAPLRPVGQNWWTIYSESCYHICNLCIEDGRLQFEAIKPGGEVIDSFSLFKLCGDTNGDDIYTASDGFLTLNYFGSGPEPVSCWAANVNGDDELTTGDAYHFLNFLGAGSDVICVPCEF
jgi:hypothetical protein